MHTSRKALRRARARARRLAAVRRLCLDAGAALALAAAASSGAFAGIVAGGSAAPSIAYQGASTAAAPELTAADSDVQSYRAPLTSGESLVPTTTYSGSTLAELAETRRLARIEALREAVAAGEAFGLTDLPEAATGPAVAALGWLWPVEGGSISDTFGTRGGAHHGIDIAAAEGTPISSAAPGIVVLSEDAYQGYGGTIIIEHADGVRTLYAHMVTGSRLMEAGDWVEAGELIGAVGNTGRSFGPHLHFEVHVGGEPTDPLTYVPLVQ